METQQALLRNMGSESWSPRSGARHHRRATGEWRGSTGCSLAAKTAAAGERTDSAQTRSSSVRADVNDLLARFVPLLLPPGGVG
jgi:hypothetical protein